MKSQSQGASQGRLQIALAIFIVLCGGAAADLIAQTNTAKPAGPEHRYLIVVETSHAMGRRVEGVLETVGTVLNTTLGKELRKGDPIATWTYNETLSTGRFPLQHWSAGARNNTVAGITNFLAREKYHKDPRLDRVMPSLASVVAHSPLLTVVLITSGTRLIVGTPYDGVINATFAEWKKQQQDKRLPFVVLFRAAEGKMTGFSIAPVPWPLNPPPLPKLPEPKILATRTNSTPPVVKKAHMLPPLIISGKKPQPPAPATNVSASAKIEVDSAHDVAPVASAPSHAPAAIGQAASAATVPHDTPSEPAPPAVTAASHSSPEVAGESNVPALASAEPDGEARLADAPSSAPPVAVAQAPARAGATASTRLEPAADATNAAAAVEPPLPERSPGIFGGFFAHLDPRLLAGLAGAVLMTAALACFCRHRNRSRVHRPISLITRSFEHKG